MKVLHVSTLNSLKSNSGVLNQLSYEVSAAKKLGIDWNTVVWSGDNDLNMDFVYVYPEAIQSRFSRRKFFFSWVKNQAVYYDAVVVRYPVFDPFFSLLDLNYRNLFYVHHTIESEALRIMRPGLMGLIYKWGELLLGALSLKKAVGLIAMTDEILEYERSRSHWARLPKPGVVIPNGISYENIRLGEDLRSSEVLNIAFIASKFFPWQGLNLLLESIANYKGFSSFKLHLIGFVDAAEMNFIIDKQLEDKVILHGVLGREEISGILASADVGLSAFSFDLNGMKQACTLKVRECLALGVPVYAGHDDVGFPEDFDFYKNGACDISEILSYAIFCKEFSREHIREKAEEYIAKDNLLQKQYDWIRRVLLEEK